MFWEQQHILQRVKSPQISFSSSPVASLGRFSPFCPQVEPQDFFQKTIVIIQILNYSFHSKPSQRRIIHLLPRLALKHFILVTPYF